MVTHHGRDQVAYVKIGAKRDGTITAFHTKILADLGAYLMLLTPTIPSLGAFVMSGVYDIPAVQTDIIGVFTNKFPTDAIRGAGRPEATHMIEVTIDQLAAELGMDRLELRRKNFIPAVAFPHETAIGVVYDSGDYPGPLDKLLEHIDAAEVRRAGRGAAAEGHLPRHRLLHLHGDLRPGAVARHRPGRLRPADRPVGVGDGARAHHRRGDRLHRHLAARPGPGDAFAQIVADRLGIDPQNVEVIHGDTGTGPQGLGTYGSRSLAVGGEAVARATDKVADKAQGDRRPPARGRARRHRARDGKFSSRARRTRA